MYINIIDYRGEEDSDIFRYRTDKFKQIQKDFSQWPDHKFICWTQHTINDNDYIGFNEVKQIPRGNPAQSRNHILNHYPVGSWIGIWDNDATLYWNKLNSIRFPTELESICNIADSKGIWSLAPFNPRQSPYPDTLPDAWTFRATVILKGTMLFLKVCEVRYDESMLALEDIDYACQLTILNRKSGKVEQVSLKEISGENSTIFTNNNRKLLYSQGKEILANKYSKYFKEDRLGNNNKFIIKRLSELQRSYWNNTILKSLRNI